MKKERIEQILLEIGFNPAIKGFEYIVAAMELFDDEKIRKGKTACLYKNIALSKGTTSLRVERAIRHTFEIVRAKGNQELVNRYLSTIHTTNSALLETLYMHLKQNESGQINNCEPSKINFSTYDNEANELVKTIKQQLIKSAISILEKELADNDN